MREVSPEMIDMLFAEDAEKAILLLTLIAPGLDEPLYLCDFQGGVVSRGQEYEYFPFTFDIPGSSETEIVRESKLKIFNRDSRISNAIRISTGNPVVTIEYVKQDDLDHVEMALVGAEVYDVEIDSPNVTASIRPKSFATEPACKARYVAARTPGLF